MSRFWACVEMQIANHWPCLDITISTSITSYDTHDTIVWASACHSIVRSRSSCSVIVFSSGASCALVLNQLCTWTAILLDRQNDWSVGQSMCNEWRELDRCETLSEVRFRQQRELIKQWQDFETEDKREPRLHWEREIGRGSCFGPFYICLTSSHYLRALHVNWDFPGILFS